VGSRQIDGFFYGLFMDAELLRQAGLKPANCRPARVSGFALRIGQRATLVPSPGDRVHGMLISLTPEEFERLYAAPGLEGYRPEAVLVQPLDGEAVPALCYNQAEAPGPDERNPEYAMRLRQLLESFGFPSESVDSVR